MVNRRIPDTAKRIAIKLAARNPQEPLDLSAILHICNMSKKTFYRARARWKATGNVRKAKAIGRGRPSVLSAGDIRYLLGLLEERPVRFLDEYARLLDMHRYNPAGITVIHRALAKAGLSVKRIIKIAKERSPSKVALFTLRAAEYHPLQLVSIDEMSKDDRTYSRLWGRAPVGERVEYDIPFVRKRRLSLLGALALDEGIIASRVIEGSFTHDEFINFLEEDLVSLCTSNLII
jgi:transposase